MTNTFDESKWNPESDARGSSLRLRKLHPSGTDGRHIVYRVGETISHAISLCDILENGRCVLLEDEVDGVGGAEELVQAVRANSVCGEYHALAAVLKPLDSAVWGWEQCGYWQVYAIERESVSRPERERIPPPAFPPIFPFALADLEPYCTDEIGYVVGHWHTVGATLGSLFEGRAFYTEADERVPAAVDRLFDLINDIGVANMYSYLAAVWEPEWSSWRICCVLETARAKGLDRDEDGMTA